MSAKRIAVSSVDWAAFASRVPANQRTQFNAFKGKCDAYLRTVTVLPETFPKIHWDHYSSRVAIPGMVEDFKKKYESLQVPYPKDTYSPKISEVEAKAMQEVKEFIKSSEESIAKLKVELEQWQKMIPFSEMTLEEYAEYFPNEAINIEKPTMFPHTADAQPGYVPPEGTEEAH